MAQIYGRRQTVGRGNDMKGKIKIESVLEVVTGLHIGGSKEFSPIGAVDSPVIQDPRTNMPIIPGSSLKGKMRTLLAKYLSDGKLREPNDDPEEVKRLSGPATQYRYRVCFCRFLCLQCAGACRCRASGGQIRERSTGCHARPTPDRSNA